MADVIDISRFLRKPAGNGARVALRQAIERMQSGPDLTPEDSVLAQLWQAGFKIVPLGDKD